MKKNTILLFFITFFYIGSYYSFGQDIDEIADYYKSQGVEVTTYVSPEDYLKYVNIDNDDFNNNVMDWNNDNTIDALDISIHYNVGGELEEVVVIAYAWCHPLHPDYNSCYCENRLP